MLDLVNWYRISDKKKTAPAGEKPKGKNKNECSEKSLKASSSEKRAKSSAHGE